jgi:hypothetical protein
MDFFRLLEVVKCHWSSLLILKICATPIHEKHIAGSSLDWADRSNENFSGLLIFGMSCDLMSPEFEAGVPHWKAIVRCMSPSNSK